MYSLLSPIFRNPNFKQTSSVMGDVSECWAGISSPATDELSDPGQVMTSQSFSFIICNLGFLHCPFLRPSENPAELHLRNWVVLAFLGLVVLAHQN